MTVPSISLNRRIDELEEVKRTLDEFRRVCSQRLSIKGDLIDGMPLNVLEDSLEMEIRRLLYQRTKAEGGFDDGGDHDESKEEPR